MDESEAFAEALTRNPLPRAQPEVRPTLPPPPPNPEDFYWPGKEDLERSKKYDTFYGSPHAPFMNPNNAVVKSAPLENIIAWRQQIASGDDRGPKVQFNINSQADADRARAQAIAAERSAVAKFGWDPGLSTFTPPTNQTIDLDGMFARKSNADWYREDAPGAAMHEAMHRGLQRLYNENKIPKGFMWNEEENMVRALMQRAFGNVELSHLKGRGQKPAPESIGYKQFLEGLKLKNSPMVDLVEKAAAEAIAQKRPRGPR